MGTRCLLIPHAAKGAYHPTGRKGAYGWGPRAGAYTVAHGCGESSRVFDGVAACGGDDAVGR